MKEATALKSSAPMKMCSVLPSTPSAPSSLLPSEPAAPAVLGEPPPSLGVLPPSFGVPPCSLTVPAAPARPSPTDSPSGAAGCSSPTAQLWRK